MGLKEITGVRREGGKEGAQGLHRSRWEFRLREAEGRGFVEGGLRGGVMVKSVEGIIGKQIGFDKFGELEVMQSFKWEMREYPAKL